jgi:uncharacterized protein (DUF488 family)
MRTEAGRRARWRAAPAQLPRKKMAVKRLVPRLCSTGRPARKMRRRLPARWIQSRCVKIHVMADHH